MADKELVRLRKQLRRVREAIQQTEEENLESGSFDGNSISHIKLELLYKRESRMVGDINRRRLRLKGYDPIFGVKVRIVEVEPDEDLGTHFDDAVTEDMEC